MLFENKNEATVEETQENNASEKADAMPKEMFQNIPGINVRFVGAKQLGNTLNSSACDVLVAASTGVLAVISAQKKRLYHGALMLLSGQEVVDCCRFAEPYQRFLIVHGKNDKNDSIRAARHAALREPICLTQAHRDHRDDIDAARERKDKKAEGKLRDEEERRFDIHLRNKNSRSYRHELIECDESAAAVMYDSALLGALLERAYELTDEEKLYHKTVYSSDQVDHGPGVGINELQSKTAADIGI